jgi:hypothetical protein
LRWARKFSTARWLLLFQPSPLSSVIAVARGCRALVADHAAGGLVKIGAKVVGHGRYVTFQLAEVVVPRKLFRKILSLIDDLRRRPAPA